MSTKSIGAWLIAFGVLSILISFAGLQFRYLWFLDELGTVAGYGLKAGLIVLGVLLVKFGDRSPAVEETEEPKNSWLHIGIGGFVVVGVIVFFVVRMALDSSDRRKLHNVPAVAAWASQPGTNWPSLVLLQRAEFYNHSTMEAGCASLIRMPDGEIVGLTAGHLLGDAGGVSPGFLRGGLELDHGKLRTLDKEIKSWQMFGPEDEERSVKVTGLYGKPDQFAEDCDQLLLRLSPPGTNGPAEALQVRLTQVLMGEQLKVIKLGYEDGEIRQTVIGAKRIPGLVFTCELEQPTDLNGCSGAPVVDKDGRLVAIVTGGTLMGLLKPSEPMRGFSAHPITELMPVFKAALRSKKKGS